MKQNYILKLAAVLVASLGSAIVFAQDVTTFTYTGAVQTYTVPAGVTAIQIECWGAQGGTGTGFDGVEGTGGLGGYSIGELAVTPGQVLEVYVGGAGDMFGPGGFNGGGQAGTNYGAAGGGGSDVRVTPFGFGDRVIVAGGGGGGAFGSYGNSGGHGGGLVGGTGSSGGGFTAGTGGTQVAGGAAGCCYGAATGGSFGLGASPGDYHNAGGGGGWYGGGSGAGHAGAGGGSSYIDGVTSGSTTAAVREGHGQIIITVLCSPITVTVSDDVICLGESFTLEGSGLGTISWDGGVENGVPFTPATSGVFTYTASSDDGGDCVYALDIEVIALPVVVATADETEICLGESVILSGSGADTYSWDMGVTDGVAFEPGVGTEIYTVTGTDAGTGCENTDEIEVIVNDLPAVAANASDNEICLGESFTLTGSGATTYVWTPDGTLDGEEITPEATGTTTYEVTGTDDNGCVNTASTEVTVYDAISITYTTEDEMMGADGSIDITVTGGNPTYSFDWDNDGTGDFDDTEDLTGLSGGTYNVTIEDEAGCSATETIVLNSQLDIEINAEHKISIYPNPTTSHITILATGSFTYDITDVNGQILLVANGVDIKEVSLEELASGIYFVNLTIDGELTTVRVVKN